jgi:hypothetical protein
MAPVRMELFFLQKDKINEALNILHFLVKRTETNMRCSDVKYRQTKHCFDEECMEKMEQTKETLRKFKDKDADESRIEYWGKA